ncbi:MAG: hypothetical protein HMLKMBBP_03240 [Planctomycetes bacterium]|nr:hypothetical protein [Planctomycetota bacterium]
MTEASRLDRALTVVGWTLLAGAVIGGFALDLRNRAWNFGVDAAVYAEMGRRIATGGEGAFQLGTVAPGVPFLIAALHGIGAPIDVAARAVALLGHGGLAFAVFALSRRTCAAAGAARGFSTLASGGVAAVFATTLYNLTTAVNPLTDHLSVAFLLLAAARIGACDTSSRPLLATGALAAASYLFRYLSLPLVAVALVAAAWPVLRDRSRSVTLRAASCALLAAPLAVAIGISAWTLARGGYDGVTGAGLHASTQAPLAVALDAGTVRSVHEATTCIQPDATVSVWLTDPAAHNAWNLYHWTAVRGPVEGFRPLARLVRRLSDAGAIAADGWRSLSSTLPSLALSAAICAWIYLAAARRLRGFGGTGLVLLASVGAAVAGGGLYGFYEPRYLWAVSATLLAGLAAGVAALLSEADRGRLPARIAGFALAALLAASLLSSARDAVGLGFGPSRRAEAETDRWIRERVAELVPAGGRVVSKYPGHVLPGERIWLPLPTLALAADGSRSHDFARMEAYVRRGRADVVVLAGRDAAPGTLVAPLASALPPGWALLAELPGRARIVAYRP